MLRESKHIYLILRVHHSCILLGSCKGTSSFRSPMWRVTLKGQCRDLIHRSMLPKCRATEPCRSPHPGPWLSCTCRRSETLRCCLLKYSKTFQNHLFICCTMQYPLLVYQKYEQLPQSLSFAVILILSSQNGCTSSMNRISKKLDGLGLYLHHWWWRALQTHWSWK